MRKSTQIFSLLHKKFNQLTKNISETRSTMKDIFQKEDYTYPWLMQSWMQEDQEYKKTVTI